MTDRLTPERLAELRRPYDQGEPDTLENLLELMATGHDGWLTKGRQVWARHLAAYQADHAALIGEIDRLTAEVEQLADFAVLTSRPKELQAERDRAVQRWHEEHRRAETLEKALAEARAQVRAACCGPWHDYETSKIDEARFPNERLNAARAVANRWHTYAHTRVRGGPGPDAAAWSVALTALGFVLRELDDDGIRPRDDAHSHADSPQAPSGGDETPRAEIEPQRPAEDFRTYRCPTPCDPGCEHRCHEGHHPDRAPAHNVAECQGRRAAAETYRRFAPKAAQAGSERIEASPRREAPQRPQERAHGLEPGDPCDATTNGARIRCQLVATGQVLAPREKGNRNHWEYHFHANPPPGNALRWTDAQSDPQGAAEGFDVWRWGESVSRIEPGTLIVPINASGGGAHADVLMTGTQALLLAEMLRDCSGAWAPDPHHCLACAELCRWEDSPRGGWWVHETDSEDGHDAVAGSPCRPGDDYCEDDDAELRRTGGGIITPEQQANTTRRAETGHA